MPKYGFEICLDGKKVEEITVDASSLTEAAQKAGERADVLRKEQGAQVSSHSQIEAHSSEEDVTAALSRNTDGVPLKLHLEPLLVVIILMAMTSTLSLAAEFISCFFPS